METNDFDFLSLKNIKFIKTKNTANYKQSKNSDVYKKNYSIVDKFGKKIILKLKNIFIPFGYELYNGQCILNLKINHTINNEIHNVFSQLLTFENELNNCSSFDDNDIMNDIENKGYYLNLKKIDDTSSMLRTHIFSSPDIYAIIGNKKFPIAQNDIKQKFANIEIELGTFWITDNNYGTLWYTKNIQIIK